MDMSNKILEAINRGINLALDNFDDGQEMVSLKVGLIEDKSKTKEVIWVRENFVDLGLPSGTLWAKYNLGCDFDLLNSNWSLSKPKDWYGKYYAWGELNYKNTYSYNNYKFGNENTLSKYTDKDKLTQLLLEDDAAYLYDKRLSMPTKELLEELKNYTTSRWISGKDDNLYMGINGLTGRVFTSTINGNKLFIPAAGYRDGSNSYTNSCCLWSSSLCLSNPICAYDLWFYADNLDVYDIDYRSRGFSVRPIINKN